jgi:uncharacterized protein YndB with AHSA1/START domain
MPITSVTSDAASLTLTVTGDYPVPVARLWDAYSDPRQLERFWGPVEWPATFTRHDMAVGGQSHYYMTGPDGTMSRGWFRFLGVDPQKRFEVEDGFADDTGVPNTQMPTMRMMFSFEPAANGSRITIQTTFASVEGMDAVMKMGMLDGMKSAMGQIDAVLADLARFAASRGTDVQLLSDTTVRVSRVVRGTVEQVWRAHHERALLQRWFTGPDGWSMPVCDVAQTVGDRYRYEWANDDGSQQFGFEGELLEYEAPYRAVATQMMIGMDGPPTRIERTLVEVDGGTLLSLVITYPSKALRDMIVGEGMTAGMETGYARLEREVLAA